MSCFLLHWENWSHQKRTSPTYVLSYGYSISPLFFCILFPFASCSFLLAVICSAILREVLSWLPSQATASFLSLLLCQNTFKKFSVHTLKFFLSHLLLNKFHSGFQLCCWIQRFSSVLLYLRSFIYIYILKYFSPGLLGQRTGFRGPLQLLHFSFLVFLPLLQPRL